MIYRLAIPGSCREHLIEADVWLGRRHSKWGLPDFAVHSVSVVRQGRRRHLSRWDDWAELAVERELEGERDAAADLARDAERNGDWL